MTFVEHARVILDPRNLGLPERPPVDEIEVDDTTDLDGKDALRVQVILSEDTTDDDITGDAAIEIKSAIRDALRSQGVEQFAFILFAKRSELEELERAE